jgi:hypothetical protein
MTVVGGKYLRRRCQESQESGIKRRRRGGNLADREKMTGKRIPGRGHGRRRVCQWRVPCRRLIRWPAHNHDIHTQDTQRSW